MQAQSSDAALSVNFGSGGRGRVRGCAWCVVVDAGVLYPDRIWDFGTDGRLGIGSSVDVVAADEDEDGGRRRGVRTRDGTETGGRGTGDGGRG